jgi:hypothetical protein
MEQWWKQNKDLLSGYTQSEVEDFKSEVEDLTGPIPLLLDRCVVDRKIDLSAAALNMVFKDVQKFMTDIRNDPNISERSFQR